MPRLLAAAPAATHGMPLPSTTKTSSTNWPQNDVLHAVFRLRAHGFTEAGALWLLGRLTDGGVRDVRRVVGAMPQDRLALLVREHERAAAHEAARRPRGDLLRLRSVARWPWRTSTSQTFGGAVA